MAGSWPDFSNEGNGSWVSGYYRPITVTNSTGAALTGYQVVITPFTDANFINNTGLVASYHFSEGAGTTTADMSGNNNNGTWNGTGAHWVAGKFGSGAQFNGTDDAITVAFPSLAPLNQQANWTWSGWVYPVNSNQFYAEGCPQLTFALYINATNAIAVNIWNVSYAGNWMTVTSTNGAVSFNTWSYLTITLINGAVGFGTLNFYVNGQFVSSATGQQENNVGTQYAAFGDNIGAYFSGGQVHSYFSGKVDEVQIFNRVLTGPEIQTRYNYYTKLQGDYSDLRFTQTLGVGSAELSYWQETDNKFWLKVPNLPTGTTFIYMYYGNNLATSSSNYTTVFISATGGTITYNGDYTIHTFTSNGTFSTGWSSINVDIQAIGGGGGGSNGGNFGGGGGAGQVVIQPNNNVTANASYIITIGNGGGSVQNGNSTTVGTLNITAAGGSISGSPINGGTSGNGYVGGTGNNNGPYGGGGGGGSTAVGSNVQVGDIGGNGGAGTTCYDSIIRAGGGGAGGAASGGSGTAGGGAGGKNLAGFYNGGNATANSGSGGGGAVNATGGSGGSGIVIIRYIKRSIASPEPAATAPGAEAQYTLTKYVQSANWTSCVKAANPVAMGNAVAVISFTAAATGTITTAHWRRFRIDETGGQPVAKLTVSVYEESGNDNFFDAADKFIASGTFNSNRTCYLNMNRWPLGTTAKTYYIVEKVALDGSGGATIRLNIVDGSYFDFEEGPCIGVPP